MKVICIAGKAQHGKTTVANYMKMSLEKRGNRVLITSYAGLVKYICKTFFGWNGKKDDEGRKLLQKVGTDIVREKAPDYWVNFIIDMLRFFGDNWDYVILDDCRFPNEITKLLAAGYEVKYIKVTRDNFKSTLSAEAKEHISENALGTIVPDFEILNSGSLTKLMNTVEEIAMWLTGELNEKQYAKLKSAAQRCFEAAIRSSYDVYEAISFFEQAEKLFKE